jgi:hypothetical protein
MSLASTTRSTPPTPSVGIYSHLRDSWGIFYAQPIVLSEPRVGGR